MATPEELYEDYLYNNTAGDFPYEVITIKNSSMTKTYNCCKEPGGITVFFEDGTETDCEGFNFDVSRETTSDDLDVSFSLVFSDIEGTLKDEADLIPLTGGDDVEVEYRIFMSSDLSAPAYGPISLIGDTLTAETDGTVTLVVSAPSLVVNRCGNLYTYDRFPPLKAYL